MRAFGVVVLLIVGCRVRTVDSPGEAPCVAAEETCDGIDQDCDGIADDGFPDADRDGTADCVDNDRDGDGSANDVDCAPDDPDRSPLAAEVCDGVDQNCNGQLDEGFTNTDTDFVPDCRDDDDDADGVPDVSDNCPLHPNADQSNRDGTPDGGDACDDDDDNDGAPDVADACPGAPDDGTDTDDDSIPDACDPDDDGDGVSDGADNCPLVANHDQVNTDGRGPGDACDLDDDDDGVPDANDVCPTVPDPAQTDADGTGGGDACDLDDDGDGVLDVIDNCPLLANPDQADHDGTGGGDACDLDDDNDTIADTIDNCPFVANPTQTDTDGTGGGDACDGDDDDDGTPDVADNCPLLANPDQADHDGTGGGDACDDDDDDDTVVDTDDNCPFVANPSQTDTDGTGGGDACDGDDDDDDVPDADDNCPLLANPDQADFDGTGGGDACDDDDDGDGVTDDLDCDDADLSVHPGAEDPCDGLDQDCDGVADDGPIDPTGLTSAVLRRVTVRETTGVDPGDVVIPLVLDPLTLDLSTFTAETLRVYDDTATPVPFWIERTTPDVLVWVRLTDLAGDEARDLLVGWGGPGTSTASGADTFDRYVSGDVVPTDATPLWNASSAECTVLTPTDVTLTASTGVLQAYRPNQAAFFVAFGKDSCPAQTEGMTLRTRARNDTTHFDRDLHTGFAWVDPVRGYTGTLPPLSAVRVIDENLEQNLQYFDRCAAMHSEVQIPTPTRANAFSTYQVELHGETVLGGVDGGAWFTHALSLDRTSTACMVPIVAANTDSGAIPITLQIDWLAVFRSPERPPSTWMCEDQALIRLPSPRDLDGDRRDDAADADMDGDGTLNGADCAPLSAAVYPGAPEACNEVDDDCDGAVDEGCDLVIDWNRPGQFANEIWHQSYLWPSSTCSAPSASTGALTWSCADDKIRTAYFPVPWVDGSRALHIEVDVTTSAWGDGAPRIGVELFDDFVPASPLYATALGHGWFFSMTDYGCTGGACSAITKSVPNGTLASGGLTKTGVAYRVRIDATPSGLAFRVTQASNGTLVTNLAATDLDPKVGYVALTCGEATCVWDDLHIWQD